MVEHRALVEDFIKQKITVLKPRRNFDYLLAHVVGKYGIVGYGFPSMTRRWCTGEKIMAMQAHATALTWSGCELPVQCAIGYAYDEQTRIENNLLAETPKYTENVYPMNEWKSTEADALAYCKERGFNWGGLYDVFDRVSCWCCPLGGITGAQKIYDHFPHLWQKLLEMESWFVPGRELGRRWTDSYTVTDLHNKFEYKKSVAARKKLLLAGAFNLPPTK